MKRYAIPLILIAAFVAGGGWYVAQRPRNLASLLSAPDDSTRRALAEKAVAEATVKSLTTFFADGSPEVRNALFAAMAVRSDDDRLAFVARVALAAVDRFDAAERELMASLMDRLGRHDADSARELMAIGLKGSPVAKELVCRAGGRSEFGMTTEIAALFGDDSPIVRRAALLAVGTNRDVVSEDAIFRLMSDRDDEVKLIAGATLQARGLDERQIELGRKLLHPDSAVRLSLLGDLLRNDGTISDLGPWLSRLGRDTDPAVRAGAARLAFECRVRSTDWLDDLADRDPDPLVRSVAGHYRQRSNAVRAAGGLAP